MGDRQHHDSFASALGTSSDSSPAPGKATPSHARYNEVYPTAIVRPDALGRPPELAEGRTQPAQGPKSAVGAPATKRPTSGVVPDMFGGALTRSGANEFACEPGDAGPHCLLSADQRQDYVRRCSTRLTIMLHQFGQAVNKIERDKLRETRGAGWKMIFAIAFSIAGRGLGPAALSILQRLKPIATIGNRAMLKAAAIQQAVRKDVVAGTMSGLGRAARTAAVGAIVGASKPDDFLQLVQDHTATWLAQASDELRSLDDLQLLALYAYLRAARLDISYYEGEIKKLLARHAKQVEPIGVGGAATYQAVWLTLDGKERLALCRKDRTPLQKFEEMVQYIQAHPDDYPDRKYDYDKPFTNRYPKPGLANDPKHWSKSHVHWRRVANQKLRAKLAARSKKLGTWFIRWIDDDMKDLAVERTKTKIGGNLIHINVDKIIHPELRNLLADEDPQYVINLPKGTK